VLAHADEIRIAGRVPLHYLVADRSGSAAAIEFLDGRLRARTGPTLPVAVLTNDTYERSLESLHRYAGSARHGAAPGPQLAGALRPHRVARQEPRAGGQRPLS
jgi:penicillin V acylase-like amidase (Ntn superfamily)